MATKEYPKFSVLMSLYYKEKPEYVRKCFDSLLVQTVRADEWIVVEDGPLTPELYGFLAEYQNKYPGLINRIPLEKNGGLGIALKEGIQHCSNELVARMDTDDIARADRFQKQLQRFMQRPDLDICGSYITEFEGSPDHIVAKREVPTRNKEIHEYQRKRDAFNHMTVMYKKSTVLAAGNYQSVPLMEDTMLWVNMMVYGVRCTNIPDYLVNARVGKDMFDRRGGWEYFKKYRAGRRKVKETGYISELDYLETIAVQFVVAVIPGKLRGYIFKHILHKQVS